MRVAMPNKPTLAKAAAKAEERGSAEQHREGYIGLRDARDTKTHAGTRDRRGNIEEAERRSQTLFGDFPATAADCTIFGR